MLYICAAVADQVFHKALLSAPLTVASAAVLGITYGQSYRSIHRFVSFSFWTAI